MRLGEGFVVVEEVLSEVLTTENLGELGHVPPVQLWNLGTVEPYMQYYEGGPFWSRGGNGRIGFFNR